MPDKNPQDAGAPDLSGAKDPDPDGIVGETPEEGELSGDEDEDRRRPSEADQRRSAE